MEINKLDLKYFINIEELIQILIIELKGKCML
jgi:hypothetical protein